ncbi:MAG: hypothetical protein ISN26_06310 [Betaproteobacteria bacterium AqS2]|uniref:Carbohydrate kinase PfkB domain-containing protein n=1 Tax=Candidatus Amphirhobacter heronislandensis TaxID=1732024 RepID=A0A930Y1S7_9GAMM|nr:hypothetical protein [Betaproteobacteria bacterium AqS2]
MIVTVGENIIDLVRNPDGLFAAVPGGSPYNLAIAAARLGAPAGYAMPISNDFFGDQLAATLEANGVAYLPTARPARPTGLAFVDIGADGQPSYAFYREQAADVAIAAAELPALGAEVDVVEVGGAPALGNKECGPVLCEWLLNLDEAVPLALDPNVRPALVDDKQSFLERCDAICARALVCRLSDEDAEYMYGSLAPDAVLDLLLGKGVALAVITLGAKGAMLATAEARTRVEIPDRGLPVQDTIAAGDCFFAALLASLRADGRLNAGALRGLDAAGLGSLGDFCVAAAQINCSRTGCNPPTRGEVEELLR